MYVFFLIDVGYFTYAVYFCLYEYRYIHVDMDIDINMGWLRLSGSLELLVSFAEFSLFYRALLQKRPIILGSLLIVANPYIEKCGEGLACTLFYI